MQGANIFQVCLSMLQEIDTAFPERPDLLNMTSRRGDFGNATRQCESRWADVEGSTTSRLYSDELGSDRHIGKNGGYVMSAGLMEDYGVSTIMRH